MSTVTNAIATDLELPGRILVVDDDPAIRKMLTLSLGKSDTVYEAKDGADGLSKIHELSPEFVITDLMMPLINGQDMITRIRQCSSGVRLPILVLTAKGEEHALLECFQRGADDFMVKPFSVEELRIRVSSIHIRQKMARDVNPLTRLPGNLVLKREINSRIQAKHPVAIAYVDIDHFKSFNDTHGFDRGDHVILLLGEIPESFTRRYSPGEIFVGHVGGDDFVVILPFSEVQALSEAVHSDFDESSRLFYTAEELARGTVRVRNRQGKEDDHPLLSLSIGVVHTSREGMTDVRRISQVAAEVKEVAKRMEGNSLFVDRRRS